MSQDAEAGAGVPAYGFPRARLVCLDGSHIEGAPAEMVLELDDGAERVVGRGDGCEFQIHAASLSRRHARIFTGLGTWGVEDLDSTNGIQVNGEAVKAAWRSAGVMRTGA